MPVIRSSALGFITRTLTSMPSQVTRHLTILECGEVALREAALNEKQGQPEASCGCDDVAHEILERIGAGDPTELKKMGRLEGVRLRRSIFQPQVYLEDLAQEAVYHAALHTAEYKMRRLYDSNLKYPETFTG